MSDLFLRGRGARSGAGVPGWLMRMAGAAIATGIYSIADGLGLWDVLGVPIWIVRLLTVTAGALLAPTAIGASLWLTLGALTALSMIVSFTPVVEPIARHFVRDDRTAPGDSTSAPDAVIVLSGAYTDEGLVTGSTMERLISGMQYARTMKIAAVALSTSALGPNGSGPSSEADQRALVALMDPDAQLHFVSNVFSTRDEAVAFTTLAKAQHWQRVLLVTSPMHSRRACATFETAGLRVQCQPAVPRGHNPKSLRSSETRRLVFQDALYEAAAALLYRARGWI